MILFVKLFKLFAFIILLIGVFRVRLAWCPNLASLFFWCQNSSCAALVHFSGGQSWPKSWPPTSWIVLAAEDFHAHHERMISVWTIELNNIQLSMKTSFSWFVQNLLNLLFYWACKKLMNEWNWWGSSPPVLLKKVHKFWKINHNLLVGAAITSTT